MTRSVLSYVLERTMRMLHPYMPFVTEEIWQNLPHVGETIVTSAWPEVEEAYMFEESKQAMQYVVEIIKAVRQARSEVNTPLSKAIPIYIKTKDAEIKQMLDEISIILKDSDIQVNL